MCETYFKHVFHVCCFSLQKYSTLYLFISVFILKYVWFSIQYNCALCDINNSGQ